MVAKRVAKCDTPSMKAFKSYIEQRRQTDSMSKIADSLGVSRAYIYDLMNARRNINLANAQRIAQATKGAVPVRSWPNLARVADAIEAVGAAQ